MKIFHKASGGNIPSRYLGIQECSVLEIWNTNS